MEPWPCWPRLKRRHEGGCNEVRHHTLAVILDITAFGNDDPVISSAASEYIQGKHGAPYSLTEVLCHLRVRVPLLRIQIAAEKREAARRSHDAAVIKLKAAA